MSEKSFDYLVLGGEHDGTVWNSHNRVEGKLFLANENQPLPKFYSPGVPAEVLIPKGEKYNVVEYPSKDGNRYLVAFLKSATDVEIEDKIAELKPRPIA
ncbi:hypothetical protein [Pectobacterium versatile]|uniref:hypothetical protein n=1 Tax=Pectobacterium versatile TaxID=2488639 RepID=UPI001BB2E1C6|nr:hypothetical protein [Pectobacterium versatile]